VNAREDSSASLRARIDALRAEREAVILAHNYQLGEVQDVADFTGDSLELSRKAAASDALVIVFCGVDFMAETAKILAPDKTVLLPEPEAVCPMAAMIDAAGLRDLRRKHPSAAAVAYVNTSAAVKAECDVCCTSANAVEIVERFPRDREIVFVPDRHLGDFVRRETGRELILWPGFCPTHARILPEHVERRRREHPQAEVLVHPECRPDTAALADRVLSTGGMVRRARESDARVFVIGTEIGLLHRLGKENPGKVFIPATEQAVCPNMKRTTLESVAWALEDGRHAVEVPDEIRRKAAAAVRAMVKEGP
jgi:quinolinate synthase